MSGERVVERQRLSPADCQFRQRTLYERLALRFPGLLTFATTLVFRLSPRSRLRRVLVRYNGRVAISASNRRDHEATFLFYGDDCESIFPPQMAQVGEPGVRGREQRILWEEKWRSEWGDFHYVPEEMFDLGDSVLMVGQMKVSGAGSGAAVDTDWAVILEISEGRAARELVFFDRREAFKAVGLSDPLQK
jgi:ketosteroid isomerase-like protein